eukprot:3772888-Ditylum_brightwellii.AAC.1
MYVDHLELFLSRNSIPGVFLYPTRGCNADLLIVDQTYPDDDGDSNKEPEAEEEELTEVEDIVSLGGNGNKY